MELLSQHKKSIYKDKKDKGESMNILKTEEEKFKDRVIWRLQRKLNIDEKEAISILNKSGMDIVLKYVKVKR